MPHCSSDLHSSNNSATIAFNKFQGSVGIGTELSSCPGSDSVTICVVRWGWGTAKEMGGAALRPSKITTGAHGL